ncbi:MAG: DsbA family oxidoreductase [Hyphomicrobiales bacterium]
MSETLLQPIEVEVVSDVVCPWCFLGKRRLEKALAMLPHTPVEVSWRPYQLDPTIPAEGMDRVAYLTAKFGGPEAIEKLHAPLKALGAAEGIDFAFGRITRSPNTLDAHRVIRWAEAEAFQDAVVERLFALYFLEGGDLTDKAVLAKAAGEAGMNRALVERLLATDADAEEVQAEANGWRSMGIEGVPAFLVGRRYAVLGAREPEVLAGAIAKVAEERLALGGRSAPGAP